MSQKIFAIPPKPTTYAGLLYRSRTEARWALFFDALSIPHRYEYEGFDLRGGSAYLPDFWLPAQRLFMEVKGVDPTDEEVGKCAELTQLSEADVLIAVGPPEERFQIRWFDRDGAREGLYVWAADKMSECGFWLVSDTVDDHEGAPLANWIGPRRTTLAPKGPMFSGAIEEAYAAARSARFDADDGLRQRRVQPLRWAADRSAAWWLAA